MKFPQINDFCRLIVLFGATAGFGAAAADTVTVAVASNFTNTLTEIAVEFEQTSGHSIRVVPGSSGRLYAQIVNGAPFDVFLSADRERPLKLEDDGLAVPGSRFTYAIGELVLLAMVPGPAGANCSEALTNLGNEKLAIANPSVAPYGQAAVQYLADVGVLEALTPNLVYGENIAQTFQFIATGNVRYALIARSQLNESHSVTGPDDVLSGCVELIHKQDDVLAQQAVLLQRAGQSDAATSFLAYLAGDNARQVIVSYGYSVAGGDN